MQKYSGLFDALDRALDRLARLCTFLSGLSLVVLVVTFGWLVYGRYILNATPTWVEQLSLLLVVVITFLSAAVGIYEKTHLSVEILPNLLSPPMQSKLRILVSITLIIFGVVMASQSWNLAEFTWSQKIPLLNVPEGLRIAPMVVCGVLVAVFSVGNILHELRFGPDNTPNGSPKDNAENAHFMGSGASSAPHPKDHS